MKTINKSINIFWRLKQSAFAKANKAELHEGVRKIGSNVSAVKKMTSLGDEMRVLLPMILGLDPTSHDWSRRVKEYWDSISEPIFESGKKLEIGFTYDASTPRTLEYIKTISSSSDVKIKTDDDIIEYLESKVKNVEADYKSRLEKSLHLTGVEKELADRQSALDREGGLLRIEEEKYKFGLPINVEDYLLYRYALVYKDVANNITDVDKSTNIRFYLYSEDQIKTDKKNRQKLKIKAMSLYTEILADKSAVENALFVLGKGDAVLNAKDESDKQTALYEVYETSPARFIDIVSDKNLSLKGEIEKFISYSILRRLPHTDTIVSNTDASLIIGNTLDDAVAFFSNKDKNLQKINEFRGLYKSLPKK